MSFTWDLYLKCMDYKHWDHKGKCRYSLLQESPDRVAQHRGHLQTQGAHALSISERRSPTDLLLRPTLLCYKLIKHCPVILVYLLHLVDVACYFFHCLQCFCKLWNQICFRIFVHFKSYPTAVMKKLKIQARIRDQHLLTTAGTTQTAQYNLVIKMKKSRIIFHLKFSLKWGSKFF